MISRRNAKHSSDFDSSKKSPKTLAIHLVEGKRYAHTATSGYQIRMASLQPDSRRLPNCACNMINKGKGPDENEDRVMVIVEHDLNEHIVCILDSKKVQQCKLNLTIQPGEQVAFRTMGKTPVQLSGIFIDVD